MWYPAIVNTLRTYNKGAFKQDLTAGLTTATMLVPQSMAYATLAGLEPITGLYAAIIPTLIYGMLGRSKALAVGPVAIDSLIVAATIAPLAGNNPTHYAAYASILMLMVGALQVLGSLFDPGKVIGAIRGSVFAGFTAAAAMHIAWSQLPSLLGLPNKTLTLANINPVVIGLAILSLLMLIGLKKWRPSWPRFMIVTILGVWLTWTLNHLGANIICVDAVEAGLPLPTIPPFSIDIVTSLIPAALVLAIMGFMESVAINKALNICEDNHKQELRAIGFANFVGGWFQAYPVTGGFSRSTVQHQAGAQTPITGIIVALLVAISLLWLSPWFAYLPVVTLAAIITSAIIGLIDLKALKTWWQQSKTDAILVLLSFITTLVFGIIPGLFVGAGASIFFHHLSKKS